MIFKVSNVVYEESRRVVDETVSSAMIESISATATVDPYIATTQLDSSNASFTVTLPNAEPGTIKIITLIAASETTVTIQYKSGWGGDNTYNMSYEGELIIFYATSKGWHTRTFLD
jgi:hypothetical protein